MHTFCNRRTARVWVTQPAHRFGASVMLALAILCASVVAIPLRDPDWVLWLFAAGGIALAVYCWWWSVLAFTEVVARFDGESRALTVTRTQPWRHREETFPYQEIVAADVRGSTGLDGAGSGDFLLLWPKTSYSLEMTLAGGRRIRLRADGEAECYDALREVRALLRA